MIDVSLHFRKVALPCAATMPWTGWPRTSIVKSELSLTQQNDKQGIATGAVGKADPGLAGGLHEQHEPRHGGLQQPDQQGHAGYRQQQTRNQEAESEVQSGWQEVELWSTLR